MSLRKHWIPACVAMAAINAPAVNLEVAVEPLFTVTGGAFAGLPTVREWTVDPGPGGSPQATHLLVGPLSPLPDGALLGSYRGVNSATGDVVEEGSIAFATAPAAPANAGRAQSPVFGVIPRAGSWAAVNTSPASGPLVDASASATLTGRDVQFSLPTAGATGSAGFIAAGEGGFDLRGITLTVGGADRQFGDALFTLAGGVYSAFLAGPGIDDLYVMTITDTRDSDSDGVPDLTDADQPWYAPYDLAGSRIDSEWYGHFWFVTQDEHWIYHVNHGYQYVQDYAGGWLLTWDVDLANWSQSSSGWIAWNGDYFWAYGLDGGTWGYYKHGTGGESGPRWFYIYGGTMGSTGLDGTGWWQVPVE